MNESMQALGNLLQEIAGHLNAGTNADKRAAVVKLERMAAVATTLAFTIKLAK